MATALSFRDIGYIFLLFYLIFSSHVFRVCFVYLYDPWKYFRTHCCRTSNHPRHFLCIQRTGYIRKIDTIRLMTCWNCCGILVFTFFLITKTREGRRGGGGESGRREREGAAARLMGLRRCWSSNIHNLEKRTFRAMKIFTQTIQSNETCGRQLVVYETRQNKIYASW